jgi:hypothetical protein
LRTELLDGAVFWVFASLKHRCLQSFGPASTVSLHGLGDDRLNDPVKMLLFTSSV